MARNLKPVFVTNETDLEIIREKRKSFLISKYINFELYGNKNTDTHIISWCLNDEEWDIMLDILAENSYHINSLIIFSRSSFLDKLTNYLSNGMLSQICIIEFSSNNINIGVKCVNAFSNVLTSIHTLKRLSLCNNSINSEGAETLAMSLKINNTLEELSLEYNNIDDTGAQALADMLLTNNSLIKLELRNNEIGNIGFQSLCEALVVNNTLESLLLSYNPITIFDPVFKTLSSNTNIINLDIANYHMSYDMIKRIKLLIDKNIYKYNQQNWRYWRHLTFPIISSCLYTNIQKNIQFSCHSMVLTSLVCNSEFSVILPIDIWKYIFTFWKRLQFN